MSLNPKADTTCTVWSQVKGSVRTFRPQTAGVLRVTTGRAWATFNPSDWAAQPRWSPELDPGDLFVGPGAELPLCAGQNVVLESWPAGSSANTRFEWEAAALSASAHRWQLAVVQPGRELGQGLLQVARALGGLVLGLASYAYVKRGMRAQCKMHA